MTMHQARILVALVGIFVPYLARLPGGAAWLMQYLDMGLGGFVFLSICNSVTWGSILTLGNLYRRTVSLLFPAVIGLGFLAWSHGRLDLRSDPQASLGLMFIPIDALLPILLGSAIGFAVDRHLTSRRPL
ncbi:MAG: hypothetical protein ABI379_13180 [Rhodanobacter sp.]